MYIGRHVKCSLFLSDFNQILSISTDFRGTLKIQNFIKIRPVEAELSHADRHKEATVAYRNFANAPKKTVFLPYFLNHRTWKIFTMFPATLDASRKKLRIVVSKGHRSENLSTKTLKHVLP